MRAAIVMTLLAASATARADTIARGAIVKVEAREIYVNLGTREHVEEGARLRIKRPIKVRHPVTRAWVEDWLPVGAADVTVAGERLSMAVLDADLLAAVAPGDVVEIYVERDEAPAAPPPPVEDEGPLPEHDPDTVAVLRVWVAQRGATLDARIAAWEGFLSAHPASAHAGAIRADLGVLTALREQLEPPSRTAARPIAGIDHHSPTRALPGERLPLVLVLSDPGAIESAWLHYRPVAAPTFERALLTRDGELYLRGEIPGDAVVAPGVEYFVEAVDAAGEARVAVAPTTVDVEPVGLSERFEPKRRRTRLSLVATYLDFATFDRRPGDHTDRLTQLEADVTYRLDGHVAGLSAGIGILDGEGGFVDPQPGVPPPHTGYQYGYAETELALSPRLGVAGRLIAGVDQTQLQLGVEGRLRIGDAEGTSLHLTASQIASVGYLTQVRFQVDPFGSVPVGLSVGVTDRPAQGDVAVRLGADIGLRAFSAIEPVLRLSYQGRTVEHSGVGLGLGLNLHW